jgi:hypothetical protein
MVSIGWEKKHKVKIGTINGKKSYTRSPPYLEVENMKDNAIYAFFPVISQNKQLLFPLHQ